jgi:serine/threonine protein phosphatase PrpC
MAIRTWVGRFCVADGRVEEEGPWLGSLIRQRPDEDADELYVLIEPASPGSAEFTSQLVDVIAQLYNKDPLSLTGALTRSLRAAHDHLREWNRRSLPEHQVGAGASCLAMRGADAYLAQVGPSLAYIRSAAGDVRRLQADDLDFEHALGVADEFESKLTRIKLEPGDLVLVASTQLEDVAPRDHIERILAGGSDDALPEFYLLCRDRPDTALVLLSCFEEQAEQPPDFLTRGGAGAQSNGTAGLEAPPDAVSMARVETPVAAVSEAAEASLAAGTADGWALPRRPIHEQVREITDATAPPPTTGVRLRGDGATPRYKRTTGPIQMPQLQIPKLAVFAALALAVVGLLAYLYIPGSVKEGREADFTSAVAAAREANARAQATGDPGLKRQLLGDARTKLAAAEKIHKDNADVASLTADVTSALAVLDAVYEVKDFKTVADLAQLVTGSLSVTRAVVGGDQAYVLDAKGKRVLRVPLDGSSAPETILQDGQPGGFVTAARPAQIAWSEQTQSLLMIDDRRQAFAYFPASNGTLPLTIRAADGIGSFDAVAGSGGNLYVLDLKSNQVWRYLPGQGGFDSERTALLDQADLRNATELAVGQDVYVLDTRQGIRRFVGKAEAAFPIAGIDTPLVSPASISVLPGSNRIVVADRGNKRIIVVSAEGAFLRQIVSPSFTDLRAVSVDEGKGLLYVLNGDTLLKAAFPP